MKVIFFTKAGLGNQIQQTEGYEAICLKYGPTDIAMGEYRKGICGYMTALAESKGATVTPVNQQHKPLWWNEKNYQGAISLTRVPYRDIPVLYQNTVPHAGNEVAFYNQIFESGLGLIKPTLPMNWRRIRGDKFTDPESYDVLIGNGGINNFNYIRKRYQRYPEIVKGLKDCKIASVGLPDEYVYPCKDLTGIGIDQTFDLISKCKLFITNDSGLYHFACAVGVQTISLFCAGTVQKNYNPAFHKTATIFTPTLECYPCQEHNWCLSRNWLTCDQWRCGSYEPTQIIRAAEDALAGKPWNGVRKASMPDYKIMPISGAPDLGRGIGRQRKEEREIVDIPLATAGGIMVKPLDWRTIPDDQIKNLNKVGNDITVEINNGPKWIYINGA